MAGENPELDHFLQKVNEIDCLVKNLVAAKDPDEHVSALKSADSFLETNEKTLGSSPESKKKIQLKYPPRDNTGVNRSVINHAAFKDDDVKSGPQLQQNMSQESFMSIMEADAKNRAARKAKKLKEANAIKELGNDEFKTGNFEKAVEHYTEALSIIKDVTALWTNRAQCHIRLGNYEQAIHDCDWALRVSEKCVKAYVHKGKALAQLQRHSEALDCFKSAIEADPSKDKIIAGYVSDIELAQRSAEEEAKAREAFDAGDAGSQSIVGVLEKLNLTNQLPYYYSGGLRILKHLMKDANEKALFRSSGGFKIVESHSYISRCFSASPRSLSQDEVDLCAAVLEAFEAACIDSESNQKAVLSILSLTDHLCRFLESQWKLTVSVKLAALRLLHIISEGELMRSQLVQTLDVDRFLSSLFELMKSTNQNLGSAATGLLNNWALDKTFKSRLRDKVEDFLPAFEEMMKSEKPTSGSVVPSCVSMVTNLCGDVTIRRKLLHRESTWLACCVAMEQFSSQPDTNESHLYAVLGLLLNLSLDTSDNLRVFAVRLAVVAQGLLSRGPQGLHERCYGLLARVLPQSDEAVSRVCRGQFVPTLLGQLKTAEGNMLKQMLRVLTSSCQQSTAVKEQVCASKDAPETLHKLLKHSDEHVIGNAALCLSHVADCDNVSDRLTHTSIIADALVLTRDAQNVTVQQNCGIMIAKLCQSNPRHLERLRELEGLGILHGVMKHIKH